MVFQQLLRAASRSQMDLPRRSRRHVLPARAAEEKNELRSGSPCFDESSEVVTRRAEPPMTGQVVSQVVSQVVRKAPAREAVAAGTAARAAAEAMESSWSVARGTILAQKVDQWQKPPLQAGIRLARQGRLLRLVSSYLPAQPHASTLHDGVRVRLGCFTNLHRLSARGPVPKVMLKLELQRWPRTSDACGPAP